MGLLMCVRATYLGRSIPVECMTEAQLNLHVPQADLPGIFDLQEPKCRETYERTEVCHEKSREERGVFENAVMEYRLALPKSAQGEMQKVKQKAGEELNNLTKSLFAALHKVHKHSMLEAVVVVGVVVCISKPFRAVNLTS